MYSNISFAYELGYIPLENYKEIKVLLDELVRIINGYVAYLKRSKIGANEPGANHFAREDSPVYLVDHAEDSEPLENQ